MEASSELDSKGAIKMPTYETKVRRFNVEEAVGILNSIGCGYDPIALISPRPDGVGFDEVSCPNDLLIYIDYERAATFVRIDYYGGPENKSIRGTLQKMVMDRLGGE